MTSAALSLDDTCTECSGDWRQLAHDAGPRLYSYCSSCTARVCYGSPEHVGQQCACGCLDRVAEGAERIVVAGKVYVPWHYVSQQRELAGVERFDDEDACEAEVSRIRAEVAARMERAVVGSYSSLSAAGGV